MRRFRSRAVAAVWLSAGYLAWVVLDVGGPVATRFVTRTAVLAACLATAWVAAKAAARHTDAARRGWALLALSAGCWFVSNAIAAFSEWSGGDPLPVPSSTDVPSTVGLVLSLLALLSFLKPALSSATRMRTLLDALIIASALVFAGWALAFEAAYQSAGDGPERMLALAYPVTDIVLVSLVIVTVLRTRPKSRLPWTLLGTGFGLFAIAHTASAYLEVARAGYSGGLDGFTWIAGCLLVGLAAMAPAEDPLPESSESRPGGAAGVLVPFVPVLLAGVVGLQRQGDGGLSTFLMANAAVVLVLMTTRQVLAQFENLDLARELEAKVMRRTADLEREERRFRSLAQNTTDVVTIVDANGVIRYQSPSVERTLRFSPDQLIGTHLGELLHPDERSETLALVASAAAPPDPPTVVDEQRLQRRDGSWCLSELTVCNLLDDDAVQGIVVTSRDIGDRTALENQLRHQALHDPLTGLGNRTLLQDRLVHALDRGRRGGGTVALLLLDLDGFKEVNDSFGHIVGDRLLVEVARRLSDSVRLEDTVARMGGDEFAVLLEEAEDDMPTVVAQRILYRMRAPMSLDGKSIVTHASLGLAVGSASMSTGAELLRNADLAMYRAKAKGKNVFEVYAPDMHSAALKRVETESDLRRALRQRELILHYQPVIEVSSGRITGAEALVRWPHPEYGLVLPGEFLPLAEESDLIVTLGRWVLGEACRQTARLRTLGFVDSGFTMALNVAIRQLVNPFLVDEVKEALADHGLEPGALVLEITEGALNEGSKEPILPTLRALKKLGVQLAIDDFGKGESSLSRLDSFPVDKLKIDRFFVDKISSADDPSSLAGVIVAMAKSLGLATVAEGVETREQLAFLRQQRCEEAQGYFLSPPLPADNFQALMEKSSKGEVPAFARPQAQRSVLA
ncbi:MAG TPA: EAL domain-containing protein [Acidimicrobiales bacterium]|nr:EAL domain-containing protein [Acidimicrobiales bacterium]